MLCVALCVINILVGLRVIKINQKMWIPKEIYIFILDASLLFINFQKNSHDNNF